MQSSAAGRRGKAGNIHISGLYTLLFEKQERKIPREEENQQEEICKEVPRNPQADKEHEREKNKRNHEKAQ